MLPLSPPCMQSSPSSSVVVVSDDAATLTPPATPPSLEPAGESVIELQCALLHIQLVLSFSPLATDIIEALDHQLDAKWRHFGIFLHVDYQIMKAIDAGIQNSERH